MDKLKQSFEIIVNEIERLDSRIDSLSGGGNGDLPSIVQPQYMQITNSTQGDHQNLIKSTSEVYLQSLSRCVIVPPKTEIFLVYSKVNVVVAEPMGDAFNPESNLVCTIEDGGRYPYEEDGEWYYGWDTIHIPFQFEHDESLSAEAITIHDNIKLQRNNTNLPREFNIYNRIYNWYDKDLIFKSQEEGLAKEKFKFEITMLLKMEPIV